MLDSMKTSVPQTLSVGPPTEGGPLAECDEHRIRNAQHARAVIRQHWARDSGHTVSTCPAYVSAAAYLSYDEDF